MNIREIQPSEIKFLEEMLYEAIYIREGLEPLPRSVIYKPEIHKYIKDWGRPFDIALAGLMNNFLVGAVWGRVFKSTDKSYGFIDEETPEISIAVINEYRNKGMGTILIKDISKAYKKIGIKTLSLSVDKENKAVNLYLRTGFEITAENGTAWTMRKTL